MQWLIYALAVVLILYSVGTIAGGYISHKLLVELGQPAVPEVQKKVVQAVEKKEKKDFRSLIRRNPFGIDLEEAVVVEPAPDPTTIAAESLIEETSIPAILIGTLAGALDNPLAIIQDTRNRSVTIYAIGEKVLDMATLVVVERQRAIVERNGKREEMVLSEDNAPKPKSTRRGGNAKKAAKPTPKQKLDIIEKGDNEYVIDKEQFNSLLTDLGPLLSSARVVPNFKNGTIDGYKVFAIKSGSLYEKIGMQNGDIIDAINGLKIETPDKALMLFQQLKSEDHFDLDIRRDGQPIAFSYDLE